MIESASSEGVEVIRSRRLDPPPSPRPVPPFDDAGVPKPTPPMPWPSLATLAASSRLPGAGRSGGNRICLSTTSFNVRQTRPVPHAW